MHGISYNISDLAKQLSTVSALSSGFALTIVLMLLGSADKRPQTKSHPECAAKAISCFVGAIFLGLLATFLLGEVGCARVDPNTGLTAEPVRTLLGFSFAVLPLIFVVELVLLGLAWSLCAHDVQADQRHIASLMAGAASFVAFAFYCFCASDLADQVHGTSLYKTAIPMSGALALLLAWRVRQKPLISKRAPQSNRLVRATIFITVLAAMGVAFTFEPQFNPREIRWQVLVALSEVIAPWVVFGVLLACALSAPTDKDFSSEAGALPPQTTSGQNVNSVPAPTASQDTVSDQTSLRRKFVTNGLTITIAGAIIVGLFTWRTAEAQSEQTRDLHTNNVRRKIYEERREILVNLDRIYWKYDTAAGFFMWDLSSGAIPAQDLKSRRASYDMVAADVKGSWSAEAMRAAMLFSQKDYENLETFFNRMFDNQTAIDWRFTAGLLQAPYTRSDPRLEAFRRELVEDRKVLKDLLTQMHSEAYADLVST